ncbi:MAG TPA: ATP-binding cassette domain-containing protein [Tepidisphaeraceae bacterium]|nr:ATP-binding cassette domain-containing protein [Tepidisphaeraceae bacterium]
MTVTRGGRKILRDITWRVPAGACAAILGPNGSGKSTLARVIMGQMWPAAGEVAVLGERFGDTDLNALRASIRLVQSNGVVEFDADETTLNVVLTGFFGTVGLYDPVTPAMRRSAIRLIRQVGLTKEAQQPYCTLSSGERMRCLIARALVVKPRLLILDEPTAGLDLLARERVLATVQRLVDSDRQPPTVLMITHHVEELLPATASVLILKDGRAAAAGKPRAVLTSAVLSKVYQFPVEVKRRAGRFWVQVHPSAWGGLVR